MTVGPLDGVRVLELGGIGPAPFAGLQLAGMGAEVVRIERIGETGPFSPPVSMGRGKRSVAIDLRSPAAIEVVLDLVARSQILIEGFRPGVAERLGVGPVECWERNPALVYGRMTGWGQDGPWSADAGHDINYIGLTGALHAIGRSGAAPVPPLSLVGDLGGGAMYLVAGVLAALPESVRTGRGQVVDAAIVDGVCALMQPMYEMGAAGEWTDERGVNLLDSGRPWYDSYRTRDGRWMSVGAIEDRFYAQFTALLGLTAEDADRTDPDRWPVLRDLIGARFVEHDRAHWEKVFVGRDACVAPVLAIAEAAEHPHLSARGSVTVADGASWPSAAPAPRFGGHPGHGAGTPAPRPGAQTRDVLGGWLTAVQVQALLDGGVVADESGPPAPGP